MSIKPINLAPEYTNKSQTVSKSVSFCGFNPIITTMDALDKGGVAATFITGDLLGIGTTRFVTGLHRNEKETGEKNWAYARLVAWRELLSGPNTFAIPALMIWGIRGAFGKANDVPIKFIKAFSDDFTEFSKNNTELLGKPKELKHAYYKHAVEIMLEDSTAGLLKGDALKTEVEKFTNMLIKMDEKPTFSQKMSNTKKQFLNLFKSKDAKVKVETKGTLTRDFIDNFIEVRKKYTDNPQNNIFRSWFRKASATPDYKNEGECIGTHVKSFISNLRDYSSDLTGSISKKFDASKSTVKEFVENFCHKRVGSRFLTNISMTVAVGLFFTIVPKIYNSKDGSNPALKGLGVDEKPSTPKKTEGK